MQGQRSAIDSLSDSINFDYGSPTSNVGVDQQIFWNNLRNPAESRLSDYRISGSGSLDTLIGGVSQEGRNLSRRSIGESSSSSQNLVNYDDRMAESGCPSMNGPVAAGLSLEVQQHEPTNFVSHTGVNLNLSSNPDVVEPSFVQTADDDSASPNHDLNDVNSDRVGDDMACLNSFASSSGSGGFRVEEGESRPGSSLDGRRLSCKRKTLEGNAGQSSSSGSFFSREAEVGMWGTDPCNDASGSDNTSIASEDTTIIPTESLYAQVDPRLGLGMGGDIPTDSLRPLSVPGNPDTSQRNHRLRMYSYMQHESVANNSLTPALGGGARRRDTLTSHRPRRYVPVSPLDLMPSNPPDSSVSQNDPVILRVPATRRNVQAHRWNGAPNSRPGSSSISTHSSERDAPFPEGTSSRNSTRNIAEHPMFVPMVGATDLAQTPTHWGASSGNVGVSRHISSNSRTGSASGSHTSPGPSSAPHRHPSPQYSRRLTEYVRRSLLSASQGSSNSQLRFGPASSQEGLPSSDGSQGNNQLRSRSALWLERQGDGAVGSSSLRALAAAGEGRSRLVSEMRNVLDAMRRGEALRFEDVMFLDQSMLFGVADVHDQHRDMRLDVDNMSYEELLALEERIGDVCTGVSEDTIMKRMKQRKYIHTTSDDQIEAEPCCICQEVYNDGEGLGMLDCGHDFHSECIKQWLAHKNLCPICKTTALAT